MPPRALHRQSQRQGSVDVREFIRFHVALGLSETRKQPEVVGHLLFQVEADAGAAAVAADRGDVHCSARDLRHLHGIVQKSHAGVAVEHGHSDPPGKFTQLMAPLELDNGLKLMKPRIEMGAVGDGRHVEHARAHGPDTLIPLHRGAHGVPPGVGGVVEISGVDGGPIEKVAARIVGVAIGVEDVSHAEFADADHHPVGAVRAAQLIGSRVGGLRRPAEIHDLAHEQAGHAQVGLVATDLVRLAAREAGDTQRAIESLALIDFAVDPAFGARPEPGPEIQGGIDRFGAAVGRQAVGPAVGGVEVRGLLFHIGELPVHGVGRWVLGRRACRRQAHQQCRRHEGGRGAEGARHARRLATGTWLRPEIP